MGCDSGRLPTVVGELVNAEEGMVQITVIRTISGGRRITTDFNHMRTTALFWNPTYQCYHVVPDRRWVAFPGYLSNADCLASSIPSRAIDSVAGYVRRLQASYLRELSRSTGPPPQPA